MFKSAFKIGCSMIAISIISGCAMTTERMPLNYKESSAATGAIRATHDTAISVGTIIDKRGENPNLIVHKKNMYQSLTIGSYEADRPLTAIIHTALDKGLNQIGYHISNDSTHIVTGSLENIDQKIIMGWFQGTMVIDIQMNLNINNRGGKTLWRENFIGRGSVTTAFPRQNDIRIAFNNALNDVVHQLQASETFYETLVK